MGDTVIHCDVRGGGGGGGGKVGEVKTASGGRGKRSAWQPKLVLGGAAGRRCSKLFIL